MTLTSNPNSYVLTHADLMSTLVSEAVGQVVSATIGTRSAERVQAKAGVLGNTRSRVSSSRRVRVAVFHTVNA